MATFSLLWMVVLASLQGSPVAPRVLNATLERDAYAIYATLLPPLWETSHGKGPMLLLRETERPTSCSTFLAKLTGEWADVAKNFDQENSRVRLLQRAVPMELPYRLTPRQEILTDDARLAVKYPGRWQRTPGSLECVAVSAVGFNSVRTKAIVYIRSRMSGDVLRMELIDGKWSQARDGETCVWRA